MRSISFQETDSCKDTGSRFKMGMMAVMDLLDITGTITNNNCIGVDSRSAYKEGIIFN
jgi:hypothetical protein